MTKHISPAGLEFKSACAPNTACYNTRGDLEAATVPVSVDVIELQGYYAPGDRGRVTLVRVGSEPSHPGKVESDDGAWWEFAPGQEITVEQFGAVGDMTWELQDMGLVVGSSTTGGSNAPRRLTGTSDLAAFEDADLYATTVAGGEYFAEADGYYLLGQFTLAGKLRSRRQGYATHIWAHSKSVYKSPIWIKTSNAEITGFSVFGQYDYSGSKPASNGQMGPTITVAQRENAQGGPSIYTTTTPEILTGIKVDCLFCRAGHAVSTPANQRSKSAYHLFSTGGVENSHYKFGAFSKTNVRSNGLAICHWGMKYTGGDPLDNEGWHDMEILETYHTCNTKFELIGHVDQIENPHGFPELIFLSGAGHCEVGDISCRGVGPINMFPGDAGNFYCNPEQKEKIFKGIRIGNVFAVDVPNSEVDAGITWASDKAISVSGNHTIQIENSNYWYDDTEVQIRRQTEADITFKSIHIHRTTFAASCRGVYVGNCHGRVDLGTVSTFGFDRGIEMEFNRGEQIAKYIEGDGTILYEFGTGGVFPLTNVNKGDAAGAAGNSNGLGYNAGNRCISLAGTTTTTTTTADAAEGDTKVMIAPITRAIYKGTPVKVGTHWVTATDFIYGNSGVPYMIVTPLPGAVLAGATVTLDEKFVVKDLKVTTASGADAVVGAHGTINRCDMSGLRWSGLRGMDLEDVQVNIVGDLPLTVGRVSPTTANFTIRGDEFTNVTVINSKILTNPRVAKHFSFSVDGAQHGGAFLHYCRIQDTADLHAGTGGTQLNNISMAWCTDADTGVHVSHPAAVGGADDTSGRYKYHDDGVLECWLRVETTDSNGDFTWTFPAPFNGGSTTVAVTATIVTTSVRIITVGAPTSTSCTIKTVTTSGSGVATAFSAHAIGRWY